MFEKIISRKYTKFPSTYLIISPINLKIWNFNIKMADEKTIFETPVRFGITSVEWNRGWVTRGVRRSKVRARLHLEINREKFPDGIFFGQGKKSPSCGTLANGDIFKCEVPFFVYHKSFVKSLAYSQSRVIFHSISIVLNFFSTWCFR